MRIRALDIELSEPIEPIWGMEGYERLYALVRHHGRPLGWINLRNHRRQMVISPERLRQTITRRLGRELVPVMLGERLGDTTSSQVPLPPISVVVCTHERPPHLARCLQSLLALHYPDYEVIVVDSAPSNDDTARLVANLPVRYVREKQPGRSRARNRGIAQACNQVIAFVEDDAIVDRQWLWFVAHAFARPEVMAVTGLTAPAELETDAQALREFSLHGAKLSYGGLQRGLRPRAIRYGGRILTGEIQSERLPRAMRRDEITTRELLWATGLGDGANMAFRRELFSAVGPFDVTFDMIKSRGNLWDAGAMRGSSAIEMLHRVVACGHVLAYEPAALVWSTHPRDFASLRSALYEHAKTFGAYLITCARNRTVRQRSVLRFAIREWLGRWMWRRLCASHGISRRLVVAELAGALASPLAYAAARKRTRVEGQSNCDR